MTMDGDYYNTKMTYLGDNYLIKAFSAYYNNFIDDFKLADLLNVKLKSLPTIETKLTGRWET